MPAKSKKQQRFFGLVKSIQEGKAKGSGKAQDAASSMSKKDVRDYAKTKHEDLPESKSAMKKEAKNVPTNPTLWEQAKAKAKAKFSVYPSAYANGWAAKWYKSQGGGWKSESDSSSSSKESTWLAENDKKRLANFAAISALTGTGAAGVYGLLKLLHDKSNLAENRLKKYETRVSIPGSRKLKKEDKSDALLNVPKDQSDMLSDADSSQSEISPELMDQMSDPVKSSDERTFAEKYVINPYIAAALTPLAMVVPGVATYHLGKKLVDMGRKSKLDKELVKAKKEFEAVLNKTSSDLQKQVDDLATKSAFLGGLFGTGQKGTIGAPGPASGPELSAKGLAYVAGLPAGVGLLLGAALMNRKMKADPERRQLKELQGLLRRQISEKAQGSVIDIEEGQEGKPTFNL
jgi:hypothetical protein